MKVFLLPFVPVLLFVMLFAGGPLIALLILGKLAQMNGGLSTGPR